ncbi:uncharacterized protein LOC131310140 [Rhododendron vialii]|uniref:uncharacterized protein LOC131310140 n=1 Tax=Rhododendron vialii TaxID=182163 RepID=UPI00265ED1FC|nr:uncharacterized protein LOC131310140 [Rhododendron vialii]
MEKQSKEKMELVRQLMEERRAEEVTSSSDESHFGGDERHLVLSGLLSQLETLNGEGKLQQPESPVDPKKGKSEIAMDAEASGCDDSGSEEIIRELKKIQKQNCITHCLLSVMIALTVAWQVSEFTLVFKVKNGLSQPFKCIGSLLTGMIKGPMENPQIADEVSCAKQQQIECPSIPLKIPELPNFDFQLALDSDKH